MTDSGGLQKEAFYAQIPCVTVRSETEWTETVQLGWNRLVDPVTEQIAQALNEASPGDADVFPYGDGNASKKIVDCIEEFLMDQK